MCVCVPTTCVHTVRTVCTVCVCKCAYTYVHTLCMYMLVQSVSSLCHCVCAGLFSTMMRDLSNIANDSPKWLVLDGDIDPMWIESLNTVMDDNKVRVQARMYCTLDQCQFAKVENCISCGSDLFLSGRSSSFLLANT